MTDKQTETLIALLVSIEQSLRTIARIAAEATEREKNNRGTMDAE